MVNNYPAITPHPEVLKIMNTCFKDEKKGDEKARDRAGDLLKNLLKKTDDGSYTLPSRSVNGQSEYMHSQQGALQESREKFAIPAGVEGLKHIKFLDLCSGLGYNAQAAIDYWAQEKVKICMDLVEISPEILGASLLLPQVQPAQGLVRKAIESHLIEESYLLFEREESVPHPNIMLNIHLKDGREALDELDEDYDAVFLDPFSPAKSPELFTTEFFQKLYLHLRQGGRILTYTNAAPVRMALIRAGFEVGAGPLSGGRKGTIARKESCDELMHLSDEEERMIALSDAGVPYQDPLLNLNPPIIRKNREKEREKVRGREKFASTVRTPIYLYKKLENHKLKNRVMRQMEKLGITDLNSLDARYLVCPQYTECVCFCGQGRFKSSKDRIEEMERRLNEYLYKKHSSTMVKLA